MQKPLIAPIACFHAAITSAVLGILAHFRLPPFFTLQQDTVLSNGRQISTEQFARIASNFFYVGSAAMLVLGIVGVRILTEANRRYIAQLPRWQRWYIWPFHGVPPANRSTPPPAA